jgi:hypothetical protein
MSRPSARRRTDLEGFIARFPRPGNAALAFSLASVVLGNAWLFRQVWTGDLKLTGIVLLLVAEGVLLTLMSALQQLRLPREHRLATGYEQLKLPDKAISWIGFAIGVGGAYVVWAFVLEETDTAMLFLTSLAAWRDAGLHIALAITAVLALAGGFADAAHYRRSGPPFVSSIDMESTARRVTFAYGAIVIAVPMFGWIAILVWTLRRLPDRWTLPAGVVLLAAFFGGFFALAHTVASGPRGWAAVYLLGKVMIEALFVLMPVLARKAARERVPVAA